MVEFLVAMGIIFLVILFAAAILFVINWFVNNQSAHDGANKRLMKLEDKVSYLEKRESKFDGYEYGGMR